MISFPMAVNNDHFKWQLDLFWFNHKLVYGESAMDKAHAAVVKRNYSTESKREVLFWNTNIPHTMCESFFDHLKIDRDRDWQGTAVPLNIQVGLKQAISLFDDEEIIEVLDCDMFHLKPYPDYKIADDELIVCDLYENWHMGTLGKNRHVIEPFFKNNGQFYNGGFVPIIGKVRTFRKILQDWIDIHLEILEGSHEAGLKWWAGMFALQAACERNQVQMTAKDCCYIPNLNTLSPDHYICHYSVDPKFDKKKWPLVDVSFLGDNIFYNRVRQWLETYSDRPGYDEVKTLVGGAPKPPPRIRTPDIRPTWGYPAVFRLSKSSNE